VTHNPSVKHQELCKNFNIKFVLINLAKYFYKEWNYPRECYYHFKAPELFYKMGYEYSIFFDGDVCCNNRVTIDFKEIVHIGGVGHVVCKKFLQNIDDFNVIKSKFKIKDDSNFNRRHTQAGIIFYNNKNLSQFKYFEKATKLYDRSIKYGIPRKGDDSLLALIIGMYKNLHVKYLISHYNYMHKTDSKAYLTNHQHLIQRCVFYHMTKCKPWIIHKKYPNYVYKYFIHKWRETMINNFSQLEIKEYYPQFYKRNLVNINRINCYWYKTSVLNFGDYITPYMMKKICNITVKKPINPLKTKQVVLLSTGSIMRLCRNSTIVWGSGIRDKNQNIKKGMIRSVRGPLTRKRLISIGCECPPIYGDPALLLPKIYKPKVVKKYKLGIVPHFTQYTKVSKMYSNSDATVIDLRTDDVENIVDKMLECEKIVSSSLHGIVVANAYSIPVRWIKFDNSIKGDDTKYYDHYHSIGRDKEIPINAMDYKKISVEHLYNCTVSYDIKINLDKLTEASFFDFDDGTIKKYIRYIIEDKNLFL